MSQIENTAELLELTTSIVSAYVSNNNVQPADLVGLIASTYSALAGLGSESAPAPAAALIPAVPIRKSVTPDAIICLEDGKKFKSLKRHLNTSYGLTPEQYRVKWGLPSDYPMVAPAYAEARSALAKSMGLGRKAAVGSARRAASPARTTRAKGSA
ncbi:MAG: MucR family transcriptional regulator [Bosea sp. (in: a-proteobacteria)]|uniref:MucR family transcriptional regulator n=1 Tax=Bosea sp. (in: a-proteobacteria) TaxID=1871050 RepID=UPI0027335C17|nr:MucR family transcriptional regulator [Bosea sp. (in: a-proteobacteria)]MDP3255240.1 MucR family transcriptional regulator [Bosea sp. (in: a-proteobacteria)]MDP3318972.1 MucR family transcriptional regulator [Bosea sp. (in: a-proteobacteria)]